MNKNILFISCIFVFSACSQKYDSEFIMVEDPTQQNNCIYSIEDFTIPTNNLDSIIDFIQCLGGFENYIYPEKYGYSYPCFNPNNSEEFAYIRHDYTVNPSCDLELWVFNYCTGESRFLCSGLCYSVDWSVKDWIVFTGTDRQLWKIKSDGDSLKRLTSSGSFNNYAMWNSTGEVLAYWKSRNTGSLFLIADEDGNSIDTLNFMSASWHWSPNDNLLSCARGSEPEEFRPASYNFSTSLFSDLPPVDATQYGFLNDTDWIGNKILWLAPLLLGTTDIETEEVIELAHGFSNRHYLNLTISPNEKLIVVEREDWFQISNCDVEIKKNLYVMNIDGSDEQRIKIPE